MPRTTRGVLQQLFSIITSHLCNYMVNTYLSIRYATQPPCSILAPLSISGSVDLKVNWNKYVEPHTFRDLYFSDRCRGQASLPLRVSFDINSCKFHRFAHFVAKTVFTTDAIGHKSIIVQLLDIVRGIAIDGGDVAVVGKCRWVNPGFSTLRCRWCGRNWC